MLFYFFFNDTATTEIYTLSLHDALPISGVRAEEGVRVWKMLMRFAAYSFNKAHATDRKSTRLNSSHTVISYAVFCLKKKKKIMKKLNNNVKKQMKQHAETKYR